MSKVELLQEPFRGYHNEAVGPRPTVVTRSLPFYKSKMTRLLYVHRVRSGLVHWHPGGHPWNAPFHISWRLWCGTHGSSGHGDTLADPGSRDVVCATCEGRALGAGFPSSILLASRPIRFTPHLVAVS